MEWSATERKRTSTFGTRRHLLPQKLNRTFPAECAHCLVVAPDQMLRKLSIKFFKTAEMLPVIEISLVITVTSLYFTVMPRCSRRYQLMLYPYISEYGIKRAFRIVTYVFIGELCPVVSLYCPDLEGELFLKKLEKLYCIFRCMLLSSSCTALP